MYVLAAGEGAESGKAGRSALGAVLAWSCGALMIMAGLFGLSIDTTMAAFDSALIALGLLALPPVTDLAWRKLGLWPAGWIHLVAALCLLSAALAADAARGASERAAYPVISHPHESWFPAIEIRPSAAAIERRRLEKANYLAAVARQTQAFDREQALFQQIGEGPSEYDDEVLRQRADLVRRRASFSLTPAEAGIVDALAARVARAQAARAPALRQAYVDAINAPLSDYGVTAKLVNGDEIVFAGAPLADPAKQALVLNLTAAERARLGFSAATFAASPPPPSMPAQDSQAAPPVSGPLG
jgi:hypothetical protein